MLPFNSTGKHLAEPLYMPGPAGGPGNLLGKHTCLSSKSPPSPQGHNWHAVCQALPPHKGELWGPGRAHRFPGTSEGQELIPPTPIPRVRIKGTDSLPSTCRSLPTMESQKGVEREAPCWPLQLAFLPGTPSALAGEWSCSAWSPKSAVKES